MFVVSEAGSDAITLLTIKKIKAMSRTVELAIY
jgi:hypothetical protein